jgi:hypothetical protein
MAAPSDGCTTDGSAVCRLRHRRVGRLPDRHDDRGGVQNQQRGFPRPR